MKHYYMLAFNILKMRRDGSAVEILAAFPKEFGLIPSIYMAAQTAVTPVPEDTTLSSGLFSCRIHVVHRQIKDGNSTLHLIQANKRITLGLERWLSS